MDCLQKINGKAITVAPSVFCGTRRATRFRFAHNYFVLLSTSPIYWTIS